MNSIILFFIIIDFFLGMFLQQLQNSLEKSFFYVLYQRTRTFIFKNLLYYVPGTVPVPYPSQPVIKYTKIRFIQFQFKVTMPVIRITYYYSKSQQFFLFLQKIVEEVQHKLIIVKILSNGFITHMYTRIPLETGTTIQFSCRN